MSFPKQIQNLIDAFERLPGVGPKTAERLAFYLLHVPDNELELFSNSLANLKKDIYLCKICKNISDKEICTICSDELRNKNIICVVESPLDVFSLEKSGQYKGLYHVLHGVIDPLHNIGPEELYIDDLLIRKAEEIILALNPTMEGEATAMYLAKKFRTLPAGRQVKTTRLGMGMPTGGDIQYADETTLIRAMEGRREY
ncbi:MAG: recombination mediator RecR [bacterium]|nr:recombination mediator RecR [bacterium]